ncbi:MAG: hypothetical protein COX79_02345 [Candidatus Levybacteria bacterium CG_4_10_14_0_2_um_filter_36_16]|nr:MAG: hypothetical protein COU26_03780 [Candidatus Levybacteria bacterium CG10_big_fil_rev_8_21_14_0_10_36_30]PIZ97417.1 MAG: hypothetical protein COX79_02345 [Candidatus Levybacteria bacterium CG_4_10_14_0_2_um_filter_36_16]
MGKIRVKTIGDESLEQEEQKKLKEKREQKTLREGQGVAHLKNMGGGQRITTVGPTEEEILAQTLDQTSQEGTTSEAQSDSGGKTKKEKFKKVKVFSKRYKENKNLVAKDTIYPLSEGISILRKFKKGKFDETVELHLNVKEKGISGQIPLPHGTGKKLRIKVADEALIAEVEKGKIDFDILIAAPATMPLLAKVAKILGPRGLMPNPKNGTITDKPDALIEKLSHGQVSYKTESEAPIIHLSVGKISFEDKQLEENIKTTLKTIGSEKINSVTLKSTMSPAIRLVVS